MNSPAVASRAQRSEEGRAGPILEFPQPLSIAVVTETYPPEVNGVAMTIGRMIEGLVRSGHRIQLVRPRQHDADAPRHSPSLQEVLVASIPLPRYAGLRVGLPAGRALVRLWRKQRPDIVHVVTEGPLGSSAVGAARGLRIPVSSDFHTNFHSYSQHYGFGLLRPVIAAYLKGLHNRTACTFVPTRQLRGQLEAEGYSGLQVVARGVDTRLFAPERRSSDLRRDWGASENDLVVMHVGRLAPEKNLPVVLSAFDQIHQRVPGARLVLVGDGPQRTVLQKKYPQHRFAGMRHGVDLAVHYASGDMFLFPSVTETYGNVTMEAMASGLAVVAFDYAAAREHIVDRESGALVPFGDTVAFTRAALGLALDEALRVTVRRTARMRAEHLDWAEVVEEFIRLLHVVVASGRGSPG